MLTLLGSLLGLLGAALPELFKFLRDKQDRAHELAVLDRQMQLQQAGASSRLEEIRITGELQAQATELQAVYNFANHPSVVAWIDGLQASVRPVITYAFFIVFAAVKIAALIGLMQADGASWVDALPKVWDEETQALFASVMALWFGGRTFRKLRGSG